MSEFHFGDEKMFIEQNSNRDLQYFVENIDNNP
jgi:hypothetical protein